MKKVYGWLLAVFLGLAAFTVTSQAAEPKVMVTDYKIKEKEITAGGEFNLSVTIYNTAKKNVKNMKVSVLSEAGEILPAEGAGTAYVEQLDAQTEETISFKMKAADGLEEKSYKLQVSLAYEDTNGVSYTVEDAIYLPVQLEQRYSFTDVMVDGEFTLGEELEITGSINNLGNGTLYNVSVKTSGDNISEQNSYIGNIEPGKSGSVDLVVTASHLSDGTARENYVIVSYEDKQGNQQESKELLSVFQQPDSEIVAPVYENVEVVKEKKDTTNTGKIVTGMIAAVVIIGVVVFMAYRKWKRKQRILEEF